MRSQFERPSRRVIEYDAVRRRVWILGQRCHHGATGSLVAAVACLGLAAGTVHAIHPPIDVRAMLAAALTGGALMAHDWEDRSIWFERGRGSQA
jgi:hypothetical protein